MQVTDVVTDHGEGPVWDVRDAVLRFVDMEAGDLMALDATGSVARRHVGRIAAALRPRLTGGWVVAVEHGFRLLDSDLRPEGEEVRALDDPGIRMNEGGCDPQGRFHCGSMAYDQAPGAAVLYRLDPDGSVHIGLTGVTISNGIQWTADGRAVLYVDTPTRRVDRYDFEPDTGALHDPRPFVRFGDGWGNPDGTAPDAEGGLWVACWGGGAIRRFDVDGRLDAVVELPVPNPSACAFGGEDGRTLWITTSRQDGGDAVARSGAVFAVETGVRGAPLHSFAG